MVNYVSVLIDISKDKLWLTEKYMEKITEENCDFLQLKERYEKDRLILDDKFLKSYMEFLSKEGVSTILELDKEKHPDLKVLKMIVSDIDSLEREVTSMENRLVSKFRMKENLMKASRAYKIYKKR